MLPCFKVKFMRSTRCALFEGLSDGEISAVAEKIKFEYKTFSRGEEIFVYGSDDGKLCHLAEGVAETIRTDENGAVALIERFSAGAAFGYGEGKELGRDYAVVVAKTRCAAWIADVCGVDLKTLPAGFLVNLLGCQQKRLAEFAARTNVLLGKTIRDKLLCYFRNCADETGSDCFDLKITLTGLSDLIFADRSAMMREIKKLRDDEVVKIDRKKVTMLKK